MTESVMYEVPGVKLITQDKKNACWLASARMVLDWRAHFGGGLTSVRLDDTTMQIYRANDGLVNEQIIPLAKRMGLTPVPPQSPSVEGLLRWMKQFGPLWTNGVKHIVVIAGIRGDENSGYEVKVYDPWPGKGVTWRSLSGWYTGFDPNVKNNSSRDTGSDVQAVFLHA